MCSVGVPFGFLCGTLYHTEVGSVVLPTPDVIGELKLGERDSMYLSSCDISQYYNRLEAPAFLVPLLGPPRVRNFDVDTVLTCEYVVPCLLCVLMGATFAVSLAQAGSMEIIRKTLLGDTLFKCDADPTSMKLRDGPGTQMVYIDDFNSVGTKRAGVNKAASHIAETLENFGFPSEEKKRQVASSEYAGVALGLWW